MSWFGLVLLVVGAYLAYKVAGALLKILMFVLVLVGAYWFAAPRLGWPSVSELVYVLGPDFGGRRIEEVARPSAIAGEVADRVTDKVIERVLAPDAKALPEPLPAPAAADEVAPLPEPAGDAPD